jgi:hypothetical protein
MFEERSLFVPIDELRQLAGIGEGKYHRVITKLEDNDLTNEATKAIREKLPGYEVLNWKEISPGPVPRIGPSRSPRRTGISHQESPHARTPRVAHASAYALTESYTCRGIAPRELLMR